MAQNKGFSLDFKGFLDLAEEMSEQFGNEALLGAAEQALTKTKEYVDKEIFLAMNGSTFNFTKGEGYSQGKAIKSFTEVSNMPVKVEGTTVTAYSGFDLEDAPEALILATYGAPHRAADTKLKNAIKVKGKVKKEVEQIQKETFINALAGAYLKKSMTKKY